MREIVAPTAALTVAMLAGALAVGKSPLRRALAIAIAIVSAAIPWAIPERFVAARAFLGFIALFPTLRTIELLRDRREHPALARVAYFFLPLDLAEARRAPPRFDRRLAIRLVVHAAIAGVGVLVVLHARDRVVVWIGAALALYGTVDVIFGSFTLGARALGIDVPEMQRDPVLAQSVGEFWGRRWNRTVGAWLRRHVFTPVARRAGPGAGVLAAFTVSGLVHFYPAWIAVGPGPAAIFGAFFLVQAILARVETALGVPRWRRPLRHAWTVVCVAGPSPMFLDPLMRALGV